MLCVNMAGQFEQPLINGHAKRHLCFSGVNIGPKCFNNRLEFKQKNMDDKRKNK